MYNNVHIGIVISVVKNKSIFGWVRKTMFRFIIFIAATNTTNSKAYFSPVYTVKYKKKVHKCRKHTI